MTRYYNENPQVTHWMEKCAVLQQELDILNEDYKKVKCAYRTYEISLEYWRDQYYEEAKRNTEASKKFNSLPWYKKLFYKFRV